jgi:murein DD-endopeptidase MepM/ murein hydrolase activator NlpD
LKILNSEQKKNRWLRLKVAPATVIIAVAVFAVILFQANRPIDDSQAIMERAKEPVETVDISSIHKGKILKNSSLYAELLNLELSHTMVAEITSRFSKIFNLRRSQPGDEFQLFLDSDENVVAFEYTTGDWKRYRLDRDEGKYIESVKDVGLDRSVRVVEGKIESTLWDALIAALPDMEVFFDMADIFAWEIDFLTEPRIGDSFKIVFELFSKDSVFVKTGNIMAAEYVLEGVPHRAFLYTDPDGRRDYYDENGYSLRRALLKSPLNYRRISSKFSYRRLHPIHKIYRPHLGVDYAAAIGTPVVAAGEGYVLFKGSKNGFGNYLEIRHSNGMVTCYGHLGGFGKGVSKGRHVVQAQVIGYVGNTGESTGPHLDYRVRKDGKYINPLKMTVPAAMPVKDAYMADFNNIIAEYTPHFIDEQPDRLLARLD